MIRLSATITLSSLLLISLGQSRLEAGGLYLNEFATPSSGTAGAGAEAYASDASTNFAAHNPAGMTRLEGHHLALGGGILVGNTEFDADADTPFGGGNGGDQASWAPIIGSHGVYSVSDDLKVGMSVFSLSGAALDPNNGWTGRFQVREIELLTLTANPSIAYRVNEKLSVAAGATLMYADIDFELSAPPGGGGEIEIDGNDFAAGFNFGLLYEVSPGTRLGAIYISKVKPTFDGDLDIDTQGGAAFSADSDLDLTFPQMVRLGIYHELDDQWALLGTVGWEDWSDYDSLDITTDGGTASIVTDWKDTFHFSGGVHYQANEDWLLQAGITYDSAPVSDNNRTADTPIDRQFRYAVGAQHTWSESLNIGGALEFIDFGNARIDDPDILLGEYDKNHAIVGTLNVSYKF
ncbi:MAG: OmpP1/FadL family transporter [Geminicoccaceae bacterium]